MTSNLLPYFFSSIASSSTEMGVGTTGANVRSVQAFLIKNGYLKLGAPTQYYGARTALAVKAFQAAHDLPQTGIVDQATFAAMNGK